jgi:alanyl-tRNA synthetase
MEYNKTKDGFKPLKQKNVDTGLGIERVAMILQNKDNVFQIDSIKPIYDKIKKSSENPDEKSLRIITDHMRAAVFILADERGVTPSNVDQGYVLRRFIRRSIRHMRLIESELELTDIADVVIKQYKDHYEILEKNKQRIKDELKKEQKKFKKTLSKGLKEFEKISEKTDHISGKDAFLLFQSFGFPIEMIVELAKEKNKIVDVKDFEKRYKKHQELSRIGAEKKFKGGLADHSEETKKLHTATHLLNQALREVLGYEVKQKGSNITKDRLRFDFNFNRKLTENEIKKIENLVNEKIKQGLEIKSEKMSLKEALDSGAQAEFGTKYPEEVFVYKIGDFSKEICNGPHVENTEELGKFKIKKEKSSAAGIRRIKAVLE